MKQLLGKLILILDVEFPRLQSGRFIIFFGVVIVIVRESLKWIVVDDIHS